MYTWEIEKIINENNGVLDSKVYLQICDTSPQINRIKYEPCCDIFKIWTNDNDKEGEFEFKVVLHKD